MTILRDSLFKYCAHIQLTRFFHKNSIFNKNFRPITGRKNLIFIDLYNKIKALYDTLLTSLINYAGDPIIIIMRPQASLTYCYGYYGK
jgi:hypothetical protein